MSRNRRAWLLAGSLLAIASVAACGARTALDDGISVGGAPPDAGPKPHDAGADADADARVVHVDDCADAGLATIFAVSESGHLFRFNPEWKMFSDPLTVDCPDTPNSMAIDRQGTAYIALTSGHLDTLSEQGGAGGGLTLPSNCSNTGLPVNQLGFKTFGMAFATDGNGPGETLYVAQGDYHHPSKGLAKIDTQTFELEFIAPFSVDLGDAVELTGTGDGRLFGLFLPNPGPGAHIAEIDKTNGQILSDQMLPVGMSNSNIAFAFWGGAFFLFTQNGSFDPTYLTRYDPTTGVATEWATLANERIVGAGVSTCAPL